MTRISISGVAIVSMLLTACTTQQERQVANGGFDYLNERQSDNFKVPEGVDQPSISREYALPEIGENAPRDQLGDKLTVHSPALVLPVVAGSHVEEGLKEATVWFDQVDDSQPLDQTIWNSLISYLEEQGIGVVSFDKEEQTLVTDWMIIESEVDSPWYTWTTTERNIGKRFEFKLDVKPHGRSAALKVELKDYLETVGDDVIADLDAEQVRRNEVDVLNKVIGHYEHQIRVADAKRIQQIRSGIPMELGFNADGDAAFVVNGEYDVVWPRLLLVLRKLGFNVKDLDKSNGLLFVTYGLRSSGWWSNLFGDDDTELGLEKDDYRISVAAQGPKTSVTLLNDENEPFDVKLVTQLYDPFAKVMAEDNLDI